MIRGVAVLGHSLLVCICAACSGPYSAPHASDESALRATIAVLETASVRTEAPEAPAPILPTVQPPSGDTEPGSVLDVGQAWRAGDLELTLSPPDVFPDMLRAYFRLRNTGDKERVLEYGPENFAAADNLGRPLTIGGISYYFRPQLQPGCTRRSLVLGGGEHHDLVFRCDKGTWEGVAIAAALTDTSLTEVVIVMSGISTLVDARWRIPIHH